MSSLGSPSPFFLAGKKAYEIERSLRFNYADSAYLNRTQSTSPTNDKKGTISFWIKKSDLGRNQHFYNVYTDGNNRGFLYFRSDVDALQMAQQVSGSFEFTIRTNQLFRDLSAWYHIVIAFDTTEGTASDRIKLYVNGSQVTSFHTANYPSQNADIVFFNLANVKIGTVHDNQANEFFGGYTTEFNYVDGTALTPASFGATDAITGQWNPKKYTGSYGTNGFYLNFSDNSGTTATTLGKDSSGNGNNFTPNNFSVAAGTGNDSVIDTPTNNFATVNALKKPTNGTSSNGNLDGSGNASSWVSFFSTILVSSGKWFCEVKVNATRVGVGIAKDGADENSYLGSAADTYAYFDLNGKWNNNSDSAYGATYTTNDIIGMALDMDAGTLIFYKNGTSQGTAFTGLSGEFALGFTVYGGSASASINYGQRAFDYTVPTGYKSLCTANLPDPTIKLPNKHFGTILYTGTGSSQTISDSNAVNFTPDWVWGKTRNTAAVHYLFDQVRGANKYLDTQTDTETTNQTDLLTAFNPNGFTLGANAGSKQVNKNGNTYVAWNWNAGDTDSATYRVVVVSDSGNKYRFRNSANTATFAQSAVVLDLAEGGTYTFDQSDSTMSSHPMKLSTTANGTHGGGTSYNTGVTYQLDGSTVTESAFVSGFSSATSRKLIITVAASAPTLYYYCHYHSGMGSSINTNSTLGSSNFDGTIQSVVKASPIAGFSIVRWTGNGSSGATIGHGLGVTPNFAIAKNRSSSANWPTVNFDLQTGGQLNTNQTFSNGNYNAYYAGQPSSSVLTLGSHGATNTNGDNYVAYVFSEVSSYSKFDSYVGNGSASGSFVFCNFKPAWIMIKRIDAAGYSWVLIDSKRDTFNVTDKGLIPNSSAAEGTGYSMDFLSNGFKLRLTGTAMNASGATYIYLCFAESPFKNARAR